MTIARFPDWHARLSRYLASVAAQPFAWGQHDCALLAAGAVEAMTGTDLAAGMRGAYNSAAGAARLLGNREVDALAAELLDECDPRRARPGDVAVVLDEESGRRALGVIQGQAIYLPGAKGLGLLPRERALRAFRVG